MTTTVTPAATFPDLSGFTTHYGVRLCEIGDDGDIVVLGHVDPRTATAAIRELLRGQLDRVEADEVIRRNSRRRDGSGWPVTHSYAVLLEHCSAWPDCRTPDAYGDTMCDIPSCFEISEYGWYLSFGATQDAPGAFPVTYWRG